MQGWGCTRGNHRGKLWPVLASRHQSSPRNPSGPYWRSAFIGNWQVMGQMENHERESTLDDEHAAGAHTDFQEVPMTTAQYVRRRSMDITCCWQSSPGPTRGQTRCCHSVLEGLGQTLSLRVMLDVRRGLRPMIFDSGFLCCDFSQV